MTGVHIIALVSALVTLSVIVEFSRRRHLHEKYAVMWLAVAVVIAVFAIFPGLFNSIAHGVGVKNPPDLLGVHRRPVPPHGLRAAQLGDRPPGGPFARPGRRGGAPAQGPGRPHQRAHVTNRGAGGGLPRPADAQCQTGPAWH